MAGATLPERVAQIYYTYGLFCSSYPFLVITLALSMVLLCCFSLLNVPLPGNIPTVINLPLHNNVQTSKGCNANSCLYPELFKMDNFHNETQKLPYVWITDKPFFYVHQIILKIGVSPWNSKLRMWDAFRGPLQEVFRLLETIRNHEDNETKESLLQLCYQIEGIKQHESKVSVEGVLPEYGCLLLSPANLWQQNLQSFSLDANIIGTIYNYQSIKKIKASIAEMAFGMHLHDTGIKRYPLRARPRVLQYAVTIFYREANERFINSLVNKLKELYPLYQETLHAWTDEVTLIYYPGQFNYHELVPLVITFFGLFIYVYFSVRKIEFIRSKIWLATCAVLTIAGSLSMSMGVCFFFGFSLSIQGKEIFTYLVIIVGLENILVLTKSVTSTDSRLDVKIRLAQGLSKEGWSITKNLLIEITILTVSFFTFVPFIQEFSIFMIVSLISDYFIQMVFFATILGIDVRRMEYFPERNNKLHLKEYFIANNALNWRFNKEFIEVNSRSPQSTAKSKTHLKLNGLSHQPPPDVVAKSKQSLNNSDTKVPKRIRLVNIWARTRFFQRAFMVWMLVWISMIVYNSEVIDYFTTTKKDNKSTKYEHNINKSKQVLYTTYNNSDQHPMAFSSVIDLDDISKTFVSNDTIVLKHFPHSRPWSKLSPSHWSSIMAQYNKSLAGKYVVILPPTLLSHRVSPELAAGFRNPDEKEPPALRWQALAAALDPITILTDFEVIETKSQADQWRKTTDLPIYPTTPMEILLLAILCTISIAVIVYMMVVLYRCVCSRHYAEWRASWNQNEKYKKIIAKQPAVQLVMEAVPLVVEGHSQEVECLVSDSETVVSSCLQGNIKIWNSQNGDLITNIDRNAFFNREKEIYEKINMSKLIKENSHNINEEAQPSTESIEVGANVNIHRLRKGLSSHLGGLRFHSNIRDLPSHVSVVDTTKYNFVKCYRDLYYIDQHYYCEAKENVDAKNVSIRKGDITDKETRDENVLALNSNEENFLRNRHRNKQNKWSNSELSSEDNEDYKRRAISESLVWCIDFYNDLIILGCANGRIEIWEACSGRLMCLWWGMETKNEWVGITHVRVLTGGRRVCAASLSGHLVLLSLDAYNATSGAHVDWRFSTAHRRTYKRIGSADADEMRGTHIGERGEARARINFCEADSRDSEEVVCYRIAQCRPHQQPITEMHIEGDRILTGGQDHVVKLFSSSELHLMFTLHGHCSAITSCFIDHITPTIAGSGSQDGLLCVWDLNSGACLYSMQAHDGAVTSLAYTTSYVVSAGADERLCIWDRFRGHMLNSIHIGLNYMSRMLPLTHTLLVMGDRNGLIVYNLSSGDVVRKVLLGQSDGCIFVRQIQPLKDGIVCDYANQLRIVRFPLVSKLSDTKHE